MIEQFSIWQRKIRRLRKNPDKYADITENSLKDGSRMTQFDSDVAEDFNSYTGIFRWPK